MNAAISNIGSNKWTLTNSILIVDDHPMTCKGYKFTLNRLMSNKLIPNYSIKIIHSLSEARSKILEAYSRDECFDLIFLDIKMPSVPEVKLYSGEDLGKLIKSLNVSSKILLMSSIGNPLAVISLLKSLNPSAFLIKGDITENTLLKSVKHAIEDTPYYSENILRLIRSQIIDAFSLNQEEREFLHLLSTGTPTNQIPEFLPWSLAKVNKKKRHLKDVLGVEQKNTFALIHKAKELGII